MRRSNIVCGALIGQVEVVADASAAINATSSDWKRELSGDESDRSQEYVCDGKQEKFVNQAQSQDIVNEDMFSSIWWGPMGDEGWLELWPSPRRHCGVQQ